MRRASAVEMGLAERLARDVVKSPEPRIIHFNHEWTPINTNEHNGFTNVSAAAFLDTMAIMTQSVFLQNYSCSLVSIRG